MKQFDFKVHIEFDDELSNKFQEDEIKNINEVLSDEIQCFVESNILNEIVGLQNENHIKVNVEIQII